MTQIRDINIYIIWSEGSHWQLQQRGNLQQKRVAFTRKCAQNIEPVSMLYDGPPGEQNATPLEPRQQRTSIPNVRLDLMKVRRLTGGTRAQPGDVRHGTGNVVAIVAITIST